MLIFGKVEINLKITTACPYKRQAVFCVNAKFVRRNVSTPIENHKLRLANNHCKVIHIKILRGKNEFSKTYSKKFSDIFYNLDFYNRRIFVNGARPSAE
jgi:hypothetical protein